MSQKIVNPSTIDPLPFAREDATSSEAGPSIQDLLKQLPAFTTVLFSGLPSDEESGEPDSSEESLQCRSFEAPLNAQHTRALKRSSEDQANQDLIGSKLLKCVQAGSLPIKSILVINNLCKQYWEAHQVRLSDGFIEEKTFFFANMLVAVFEIKFLTLSELKTDKEIEVYKMSEEQLNRFASRMTQKFVKICIKPTENKKIAWEAIVEKLAAETASNIRRAIINLPAFSFSALEAIFASGEKEILPSQQNSGETSQNPLSQSRAMQDSADDLSIDEKGKGDCNNLSTVTEGNVTDMDISLALPFNESLDVGLQNASLEAGKCEADEEKESVE